LLDCTYDDLNPWPAASDGGGHSLVLMAPALGIDLNNPANWRPSLTIHGNPTTSDALLFNGIATNDTDADGLNAATEFALGTSDNVFTGDPLAFSDPITRDFSIDHANGADAPMTPLASTDLSLWNEPVLLTRRTLLPNGKLRSTWRTTAPRDRVFLRLP
jgi:hypothetical protein